MSKLRIIVRKGRARRAILYAQMDTFLLHLLPNVKPPYTVTIEHSDFGRWIERIEGARKSPISRE